MEDLNEHRQGGGGRYNKRSGGENEDEREVRGVEMH